MDFSQFPISDLLKALGQGMVGAPNIGTGIGRGAGLFGQQMDYNKTVNQVLGSNGNDPYSSKIAPILKGLSPDIGLPLLLSTLKPHEFDTVTDGSGQVHKIDKVTGQDLGTIGDGKPLTLDPSKINLIPNNMMGGQAGAPQQAAPDAQPIPSSPPMNSGQRNLANNNPGNLRVPGKKDFQKFQSMGDGISAVTNQLGLYGKRGLNTVAGIISTYAPPSDGNDTASYVNGVASDLGVAPTAPLNMKDPHVLAAMTQSIIKHEQGGTPIQAQPQQPSPGINIPGYTAIAPQPQWHQITDPAEAKKYGVNVGSSVNPATGEVKPISAYNMPVDSTDPSVRMYGAILAETGHLPTGAGRDAASMRAYRTAAHDYLAAQGLTEDQIAKRIPANALGYKAQGSAANQMAKTNVGTAVNEGTVNNSINIVRHLLPFAASTGSFTDINALTQALSRKTNDKNAVLLKNGIDSISSEYARVMTGTTNGTASSDASRKEAGERILMGYNNGTLNAVLDQMQQEMAGRSGSQSAVLKSVTNGSYSGVPVPFAGNQAPVAIPGRPNVSAPAATVIHYDASGNRVQ